MQSALRTLFRILLGTGLLFTGSAHFRLASDFRAQVPPWMPLPEAVIAVSGVMEIALGISLILLTNHLRAVGAFTAAFFVVIFPGNLSQYFTHTSAFGLDSDSARLTRLFFQPLLVVIAIWSTNAWPTVKRVIKR